MTDVKTELRFFVSLESDLKGRGMPAERATLWARAQIERARQRERRGRPFAILALFGETAADKIFELDAAGSAPRAWY